MDLFGPGTIFYRNRMRERARNKAANKGEQFRGANVGFSLRLTQNIAPTGNDKQAQKNMDYYDDKDATFFSPRVGDMTKDIQDDEESVEENTIPLEANTFKVEYEKHINYDYSRILYTAVFDI